MTQLVYEDTVSSVPLDEKGGLGVAIEKLAALLGCEDETIGWGNREVLVPEREPAALGWVALSDCEGIIYILHNNEVVASVMWAARGSWWAVAETPEGRKWRCEGPNGEPTCGDWEEVDKGA